MNITDTNYNFLKANYTDFQNNLINVGNDFGGPSLYFHKRSLEEKNKSFLSDTHIENIYATLVAWGMHRMGDTSTKMVDFDVFKNSIINQKDILITLKDYKINDLNLDRNVLIEQLKSICFSFQVSISNSKIVGNSKTLAHILPDLVPPIDRQYTIRFFTNEPRSAENTKGLFKNLSDFKNIDEEKKYFDHILIKTFDFVNHIFTDKNVILDGNFNTSYPKIFDNFIMTYVKREKNGA